jgi:glutamine synthetase
MWMARYILFRLGEEWGLDVVIDPKPVKGDWNGSGCHTNYSTKATRDPAIGWKTIIEDHLVKLKEKHMEHIFVYGEGNKYRMLGTHETASYDEFSYGVGSRGCSVRVPVGTAADKCGYYEDRRPASNINPYVSCAILVDTTCCNSKFCGEIIK